jgi:hypothetical protein
MKRASRTPKNSEVVLSAAKLSNHEARFIVSDYYFCQEMRKRTDMQMRHLGENVTDANVRILGWTSHVASEWEMTVQKMLAKYAEASSVGQWMLAQYGVGPVIAAGMLAHLDIERAPTAGHFWSFSGLNPAQKWEKGQKRPYCAAMKQLCFHFGECVKRTSGAEESFYGKLYRERKALIVARNEEGYNAERAKTFKTASAEVRKQLAEGMLPAGNLDRQACNYAAKIFLSHLHAVMFFDRYKLSAPMPYSIAMLKHVHFIEIPHGEKFFPGLKAAMQRGPSQHECGGGVFDSTQQAAE